MKLIVLLSLCVMLANCHNWIHGDSRCSHACQAQPAPPRQGPRQPHRQVGPGQDFVIEWVTGHGGWFYFVVVKATNEDSLKLHAPSLLDDYIRNAPDSAYIYSDEKYDRIHVSCNHLNPDNPNRGGCKKAKYNDGSYYERPLNANEDLWIDRSAFNPSKYRMSDLAQFKYKRSDISGDRRISYLNAKYPWIEAVHRFRINYGQFGQEFDSARFSIPARGGSGEYVVHMLWNGYTDVVDVDVLPTPANDIYGSVSSNKKWIKIEHCQYPNVRKNFWSDCRYYQPGQSVHPSLDLCTGDARSDRCDAVTCVPLYTPDLVKIHGSSPEEANAPWFLPGRAADVANGNHRNDCFLEDIPDWANGDTFVCGGLMSATPKDPAFNSETEEVFYVRDDDPEDPIFYSTCFRMESDRVFENNSDCPLCEGASAEPVVPRWQIGNKCLSCESAQYTGEANGEVSARFGTYPRYTLKKWEFAEKCERCF